MAKDSIKNTVIAVCVIIAVSGWICFFTKDNKGEIKQLEKENRILADSIKKIEKSNEAIIADLRQAHEKTVKDSLNYENEVKQLKELVSRIKFSHDKNVKQVSMVKRFTSDEVDSAYAAALKRYNHLIR